MPLNEHKIITIGSIGYKTITYTVTYSDGQEISRKIKSSAITVQPVTQVQAIGTYVAPVAIEPTETERNKFIDFLMGLFDWLINKLNWRK